MNQLGAENLVNKDKQMEKYSSFSIYGFDSSAQLEKKNKLTCCVFEIKLKVVRNKFSTTFEQR